MLKKLGRGVCGSGLLTFDFGAGYPRAVSAIDAAFAPAWLFQDNCGFRFLVFLFFFCFDGKFSGVLVLRETLHFCFSLFPFSYVFFSFCFHDGNWTRTEMEKTANKGSEKKKGTGCLQFLIHDYS